MKKIGAAIAAIVALALGSIAIYSQTISSESVPADDEITLHIQLDTEEDVGLLIYDYCANGHEYSGGISNADRSLLKRNEELIVVWNQQALNNPSDTRLAVGNVGQSAFFATGQIEQSLRALYGCAGQKSELSADDPLASSVRMKVS